MGIVVLIVVIILVVIVGFVFVGMYNGLVRGRNRVREAWSGIDVQLKRRASLIPNLVETVKGYAAHERGTFDEVTQARARLQTASTPADAANANNMLTNALGRLFAVAENYPQLQAAQNFRELQAELSDIEEKIAFARQFYNTNVLDYNNRIGTVPTSVIAGMFGFTPEQFFQAEETAREDVHVDFGTAAPPATPAGPTDAGASSGGTQASS